MALSLLAPIAACAAGSGEKILFNGKIVTVNKRFDIVEAVAIRDGKFLAVGTNQQVRAAVGPNAEAIDLGGRTVIPGLIDSHAHMDREGLKFILPSLQGVSSIEDILAIVAREVKSRKPGEWIVTMPLGDYPEFDRKPELLREKRYPTRWDLDKASPNNPVYISGRWLYWGGTSPVVSIANSYALKLAGIDKNTKAPYPALKIRTNNEGEPNGIFEEPGPLTAIEYSLLRVVPRFTHENRVKGLKDSMQRYNAVGVTSVYEAHGVAPSIIQAYKELHDQGQMTVRSHLVVSPAWDAARGSSLYDILAGWDSHLSGRGLGDDLLRLSGIFAEVGRSDVTEIRRRDSSYAGWSSYSVDALLPEERGSLFDLLLAAAKANVRAHAITFARADIERHLQVLERVNQIVPLNGKRFVMEHVTSVSEANQDKMVKLGVIPTVEPGSITEVPLQSFVRKGIPFAIGTDNVPYNPFYALGVAVSRKSSVTGKMIAPEQRISPEEALKALTINGAYLSYEEDRKGSIEVGKLADMAVLSQDLLKAPAEDIAGIQVLMTLMGGDVVYRSKNF
ncbi:MAG: amidohydrolase [Pseudomonadota bacterium]